ncbi:phage tail protein [Pseudogemmobacter faecipullorum]|uniref:Phage tail protein n=1 Tax=Pseudogemmobacter faecipullorum TaxID=2755041 RepID=A0ABS8CTU6_9RHOB|nr:phage tail protein [Pseudogemmobacter faecipullorum]MCB5412250.1 phage tail protein [Pseudogemmobacter faecipullorum]
MARPPRAPTVQFSKFYVRLSDGAVAPAFIAPCGFTSKSFSRSKTFGETNVPACPDEDKPSWTERDVQSMTSSISGDGVLMKSAVATWEAALASVESIECEVELVYPDGDSELYTGFYHLESFEITGTKGERVTASIAMQSDGEVTYSRETA